MLAYLASHLPELATVVLVHLAVVVSPGPDFVMAVRNSLAYGRRTGFATAVGFGLSILVHVTYSLLGVALIISQSILLFNAIKTVGALYLVWMGWKALHAKRATVVDDRDAAPAATPISARRAVAQGFLTNLLNPKATLFFLSLFSLVLGPATPLSVKMLYGAEMSLVTVLWFSLVAFFFTVPAVSRRYRAIGHWIDRAMGAVLVALGVKILLTSKK